MKQEFVTLPREAIERALAALDAEDQYRAAIVLRAALEQPVEQEPVAWAIFVDSGNARMWTTFQPHIQKLADAEGLAVTPLYTHPQPRHPLTDEQIRNIGAALPEGHRFHSRMFARAIEAAHNIK